MRKRYQLKYLKMTCPEFPAQWEGKTFCGKFVYIRYRSGSLRLSVGKTFDKAVVKQHNIDTALIPFGHAHQGQLPLMLLRALAEPYFDFSMCILLEAEVKLYKYNLTQEQQKSDMYREGYLIKSMHPLQFGEKTTYKEGDMAIEITSDAERYMEAPDHKEFDWKDLENATKENSDV